jgi:hypothetical protein
VGQKRYQATITATVDGNDTQFTIADYWLVAGCASHLYLKIFIVDSIIIYIVLTCEKCPSLTYPSSGLSISTAFPGLFVTSAWRCPDDKFC